MEIFWVISEVVFWAMCLSFVVALVIRATCGYDLSRNEEEIYERHIHEDKNDTQ